MRGAPSGEPLIAVREGPHHPARVVAHITGQRLKGSIFPLFVMPAADYSGFRFIRRSCRDVGPLQRLRPPFTRCTNSGFAPQKFDALGALWCSRLETACGVSWNPTGIGVSPKKFLGCNPLWSTECYSLPMQLLVELLPLTAGDLLIAR